MKTEILSQPNGRPHGGKLSAARDNFQYYDLSQLRGISRGNEEFIRKIVSHFIIHTPPIIEKMVDCRNDNDLEGMGKAAHQLKQSIFAMGIELLKEPVVELVQAGRNQQAGPMLFSKMDFLIQILEQVIRELKTEFNIS